MNALIWLTAVGLGLPCCSYLLYPLVLFFLASMAQMGRDAGYLLRREERRRRGRVTRRVSLIVAAHNEERDIARLLDSCMAQDYPRDALEILVGSDASTDRTEEIVRGYAAREVRLLAFGERRGKLPVLKDCVAAATGEILVFTDANTALQPDAVSRLARHFDNPLIGGVCGEIRLVTAQGDPTREGIYWRYEMMLKLMESRLDSVLGANGALYALRAELFPDVPAGLITDDFVIPMKVRSRGFRVIYDPEAAVTETAPVGASDEFRRRVRIGAGNWQALWVCADMLLPWKGFVSFAFWSHKVLRWATPFLLAVALAASVCLAPAGRWWAWLLAAQAAFYAAALAGWLVQRSGRRAGPFTLPAYFCLLNLAMAIGMVRGLMGRQRSAWVRTARGVALPGGGE